MEFFDVLNTRHSVRSYLPKPVPRELIEKVVEAAVLAPSAKNECPWHLYVTQGERRERLGEIMAQSTTYLEEYIEVLGPEKYEFALHWYDSLGQAPVVIVCTVHKGETELERVNRLIGIGTATENMLLTATALGLGACNITFALLVGEDIEKELNVPDDWMLASIMVLGYPTDETLSAPPHACDIAEYLD